LPQEGRYYEEQLDDTQIAGTPNSSQSHAVFVLESVLSMLSQQHKEVSVPYLLERTMRGGAIQTGS
jgi:hypothetical protein